MSLLPLHFPAESAAGRLLAGLQAFLLDPQLQDARTRGFLVACSGGADSCALLWSAAHAAAVSGFRLEAATVDHGIRPASARDADFVAALCARLKITCHRVRLEMPSNAGENALRDARYAFFDACLRERNLGGLLLGHTAEDQAETVLLHLIRGTGLRGLGAMRPIDGTRLRPFLGCSKEDLRAFLRELGETWREDESNRKEIYLRNRVRHGLLAWMQKENPRIVESLCRTADLARLEHDAVVELAERRLAARLQFADLAQALPLAEWLQDPPGVRMLVLRRWWRYLAPGKTELPAELAAAACRDIETGSASVRDWPGRVKVSADHGWIVLCRHPAEIKNLCIRFPKPPKDPNGQEKTAGFRLIPDEEGEIALPSDAFPLTLRAPAPGDRFRRDGHPATRCKKLLERVPRGLRPYALALADEEGFVRWQMFVSEPPDASDKIPRFRLEFRGTRVPVRLPPSVPLDPRTR